MPLAHSLLTLLAASVTTIFVLFEITGPGWAFVIFLLLAARFFLARGSKATLVNFIWALLVVTLLCTLGSYWWLSQDRVLTVIYSKTLLRLALDGTAGRVILSVLMGLLGSVLTIVLPLYLILRVSTEWILALGESMGVNRNLAWRLLFSLVLRINKPYIIVEDGERKVTKPAGILETIGGPGLVVVRPFNAIVCEQSGQVSKIVGAGVTTLEKFEFIKAALSLRSKWECFELEDVMTKDNVPLLVRGGVSFRIMDATTAREHRDQADPVVRRWREIVGEPDYPVHQWTLYKAVYGVSESKDWDWIQQAKGVAGAQVRVAISQYRLDEIFIVDEQLRVAMRAPIAKTIADKATDAANKLTIDWGVNTNLLVIDYLEMPAKVQEDFLERWRSPWKGWQTILEAAASGAASVLQAGDEGLATYVRSLGEGQARLVEGNVEAELEAARMQAEMWRIVAEAQARREAALFKESTKHLATVGKALRHWDVVKIGTSERATRIAAAEFEAELRKIEQIRQAETRQQVAQKDALAGYIAAIIDAVSRWEVAEVEAEITKTAAVGESEARYISAVGEALQRWEVVSIGNEAKETQKAAAQLEAMIKGIEQLGQSQVRREVAEVDADSTMIAAKLERQRRILASRDSAENEVFYCRRLTETLMDILGPGSADQVGKMMEKLIDRRASIEQLKYISGILDIASRGLPAMGSRWPLFSGDQRPTTEGSGQQNQNGQDGTRQAREQ